MTRFEPNAAQTHWWAPNEALFRRIVRHDAKESSARLGHAEMVHLHDYGQACNDRCVLVDPET